MKTNIKMLHTFQWLAFNSTSYSFYTTFGYHPYTYYIDVLFQGNAKKKQKKTHLIIALSLPDQRLMLSSN